MIGYTNEYVAHDDIIKFKLDEFINKYQNTTASYEHHWIVNRQTQSWLISIKQLNNYETLWIFHYKDTNIEVKLYKAEDGWDLTSIAKNPFNNQEIIHSLREALKVLDNTNIIYSTKKEISVEEDNTPKVNIKKTVRRKINYLDILIAVIAAVIIFFIINNSDDITSPKAEDKKPKTTKTKIYNKIDSYESLNEFIKDGQKNGYFPKKILTGVIPGKNDRLQPINIEHYKKIKWDINAKCSNSASDIILGVDNKNHSIECGGGDTVVITGEGNDWVDDAFGNDIFYTGEGNDTIKTSWGNDIFIFEKNWGNDKINFRPNTIDTSRIKGYDGSYPWKFTSFIIFGKDINHSDIYWDGNTLVHKKTGDTIKLNSRNINIIFSNENNSKIVDKNFIPVKKESKKIDISQIKGQSLTIKDATIYLTNDKFSIMHFKNNTTLTVNSETYLPGPNVTSTTIKRDIAYVTQAAGGFTEGAGGWVSIIDISNSTKPKILTTLKFENNIFNVAVNGNYLYVADTNFSYSKNRKLFIYDISIPNNPKLISTTKLRHSSRTIAYSNKLLFLSTFNNGIKIFDVNNPKKPIKVPHNFSFNARIKNIKTDGNKVILFQEKNIVSILKINRFQEIERTCNIKTDKLYEHSSNSSSSIAIRNGLLYTADLREGIGIIDINSCKFKERIPFHDMVVTSVGIIGNKLLAMNTNKMAIYDLDHQDNPYSKLSQDQLQTLLYNASVEDDANKVKKLCKAGANPNISGHNLHTPLQISARLGKLKALKSLLDNGAKIDGTSMMVAALREQIEAMKLLERYGGNIGQTDKDGCSTLHYIAQDGTVEMVKYLVKKGVSYKNTCRNNQTPLQWAKIGNNTSVIKYLENLDTN